MTSKAVSLAMAVFFVATMYFSDGAESAWQVGIGMMFVLSLIWFGDEMGGYIGPTGRGSITSTSPGWMVRGIGWLLLAMAFLASIFQIIDKT